VHIPSPDEVLARFDFVIASVHGRFKLDRDAQTSTQPISRYQAIRSACDLVIRHFP
jgi:histidinol phosphatase-like PHP family hydrolase